MNLLGVKYIINCIDDTDYGYELLESSGPYNIYLNKEYLPFGFNVKKYISDEEYQFIDYDVRKRLLQDTVVLNEDQIERYKYLFDNKKIKYEVLDFTYGVNSFTSHIETNKPALAIYAIPYDRGWKAYINGKEANVEDVDYGLIGVLVESGNNEVIFSYQTPGLRVGLIISGLSILFYMGYVVFYKKKESSNK